MKKLLNNIAMLAITLMGVFACSCSEDEKTPPQLELSNQYVTCESSSQFITVKTDGRWSLKAAVNGIVAPWISFAPEVGEGSSRSIVMKIDANHSEEARNCEIRLTSNGFLVKQELSQDGTHETVKPEPVDPDEPEKPKPTPSDVKKVSISDFLAAKANNETWYQLTGKISDIWMDKDDKSKPNPWGNFDLVDLKDSNVKIHIHGLTNVKSEKNDKSFPEIGLKEGDVVTIVTMRRDFEKDGKVIPQGGGNPPAYFVSKGEGGGSVDPTPDPKPNPEPEPDPKPTPTPDPSDSKAPCGWMELPAMEASDGIWIKHYIEGGSVRNYSMCYSEKDLVATWVAYPHCRYYLGSQKRTNRWGFDPAISSNRQQCLKRGYGDRIHDRGHQIPSGDRTCSFEANVQTFYYTNMTPQIGKKLNQAIWQKLEMKVRDWLGDSDTLYVVTGAYLKGSTKKAHDNYGKEVTIPVGYYKALLRYKKNSTISEYMGCAIYLENKDYAESHPQKKMFMSIDDLEKKVGIDFFANLPAKIGKEKAAKIEAENPQNNSWWWK